MSYGNVPDRWSSCSNSDFIAWWRSEGYTCMKEVSDGGNDGGDDEGKDLKNVAMEVKLLEDLCFQNSVFFCLSICQKLVGVLKLKS